MSICDDFLRNPSVNPRSGRKIKSTGRVYQKLVKECTTRVTSQSKTTDEFDYILEQVHPELVISPTSKVLLTSIINAYIKKVKSASKKMNTIDAIKTVLDSVGEYLRDAIIERAGDVEKDAVKKTVQYLLSEILDLAGNVSKKTNKILPSHIIRVLNDDVDLNSFICSIKPIKGVKCG